MRSTTTTLMDQPVVGARGGNIFSGWSQVLLRYQLAGYAWATGALWRGAALDISAGDET